MVRTKEELSHNLAREWVADRLAAARVKHATTESEWIGKGIAWPQTSGEFDDPTGVEEPEIVKVYVTVPAGIEECAINEMVAYMRAETAAEPRLGGRVGDGSMRDGQDDIEIVDDPDLGPQAQRVGLSFRISDPGNGCLGRRSKTECVGLQLEVDYMTAGGALALEPTSEEVRSSRPRLVGPEAVDRGRTLE